MSPDSGTSSLGSTSSQPKGRYDGDDKEHTCSLFLNKLQLSSILEYISTIPSAASRASAKSYLNLVDKASMNRDGRAYIMLFRDGRTPLDENQLRRYKHLNRSFSAPLISEDVVKPSVWLDDQFAIKSEMEVVMGETWWVDDLKVREDFGKVY
ncbi:hypothetical protein IFR05_008712, partial [Cadophora sp. M221]